MSALEKITSNEERISSTKRPRSDKCPSPSKRLPLTSSRVLHSRVLILRGLYQFRAQTLILIVFPYIQGFKSTCLTWPDVVIDRKTLWSGVCVDRKFLHLVCILWSDVDINLTMSHPRWTRVLMFIPMVAIKIHDRKSFYLFSINVEYTQNSGQFYLITPGRNWPRMVLKNFNSSVL